MSYKTPYEETGIDRGAIVGVHELGLQASVAQERLREYLLASNQGPSRFQQILTAPHTSSRLTYSLWDIYNAFPLSLRRAVGSVVNVTGAEKTLVGTVGDLVGALREKLPMAIEVNTALLAPVLRLNPGSSSYRNRRNRLVSPGQAPSPRRTRVATLVIYLGTVIVLTSAFHPGFIRYMSVHLGRSYGGPLGVVGQDALECEQEYTGRFLRIHNRKSAMCFMSYPAMSSSQTTHDCRPRLCARGEYEVSNRAPEQSVRVPLCRRNAQWRRKQWLYSRT